MTSRKQDGTELQTYSTSSTAFGDICIQTRFNRKDPNRMLGIFQMPLVCDGLKLIIGHAMIIFTFYPEDIKLNCQWWAARYVMVLIISLWLYPVAMATGVWPSCPDSCQFSLLSDFSTAATCHLSQQADYLAVSELPSHTTQLTCIINGTFKED